MARLTKLRAGHYDSNQRCECGGRVLIERVGTGDWRWESYCEKCLTCDCNGWPTLAKAQQEVAGYFCSTPADPPATKTPDP